MAKNAEKGKGREGSVKKRTQFKSKKTGLWIKRGEGGKFLDVKTTGGKFKGVRKKAAKKATKKKH